MNESASALGLYQCECDHPANALFSTFSSTILSLLGTWGVTPTYIAATGAEYSGKYFRFGSRAHDRLVHSGFERINALSIAVTPPGSTKPSYDSVVSASCGYIEAIRELLVCIVVNEKYVSLYSPAYEKMLLSLVAICRWDFGYGFSSSVEDQPDFHLLGLDNGRLSPGEYDSLCKWYAATGDARKAFLRNIYPYNL